MNRAAYYNEIDPYAAQWLRNLIAAGRIAAGDVDERSVVDVRPDELRGYTQCHFFAGIGVWSHALRLAGWPDDRTVWTGSCPCQPFSAAGKGTGFADERHLWPAFFHLIEQCHPPVVFGEQVASKAVEPWIDLVQADLEAVGYAFGCVPFPSASVGAPHIRDRAYWVADAATLGRQRKQDTEPTSIQCKVFQKREQRIEPCSHGTAFRSLANPGGERLERGDQGEVGGQRQAIERSGGAVGLADPECNKEYQEQQRPTENEGRRSANEPCGRCVVDAGGSTGPTNGYWQDVDWLFCRDGKWRPTESIAVEMDDGLAARLGYMRIGGRYSLNPLVQKGENRVMRLKGYGNAIVAPQAQAFIETYMEIVR